MFKDVLYLRDIDIYFLKVAYFFKTSLDIEYSRFSRKQCDVIRAEFTQYASVHSNFTAFYRTFKRYLHYDLCPRWSAKGLKGTVVQSLEITLTVPLISNFSRKSLSRVRSEIVLMDVRIGVVEHTLLQVNLQTNHKKDCSEITKTSWGSQISEQSLQNKIHKIDFSFFAAF